MEQLISLTLASAGYRLKMLLMFTLESVCVINNVCSFTTFFF